MSETPGLVQVAEQRRTLDAPITSAELAESQHAARSMLADLFLHLNVSDDSASEAQARRILSGLGCDTQKQDGAISQLSGKRDFTIHGRSYECLKRICREP